MTTLQQKPKNEDEQARRVETLLHAASEWEPDTTLPEDVVSRAVARLEAKPSLLRWWQQLWGSRSQCLKPRAGMRWWGMGTLGLTAAAATVVLITRTSGVLTLPNSLESTPIPSPAYSKSVGFDTTSGGDSATDTMTPSGDGRTVANAMTNRESTENTTRRAPKTIQRPTGSPTIVPQVRDSRIEPKFMQPKVRLADRTPVRSRLKRSRPEPMRLTSTPRLLQTESVASEATKLSRVWEEESVPEENYRVMVPVTVTQVSPESGEIITIPTMMELTFQSNNIPADYEQE